MGEQHLRSTGLRFKGLRWILISTGYPVSVASSDEVVESVETVEQVEEMDALGEWLDLGLGIELAVGEIDP
jgi:hypothetical protein